jgi:hypothetical protein
LRRDPRQNQGRRPVLRRTEPKVKPGGKRRLPDRVGAGKMAAGAAAAAGAEAAEIARPGMGRRSASE